MLRARATKDLETEAVLRFGGRWGALIANEPAQQAAVAEQRELLDTLRAEVAAERQRSAALERALVLVGGGCEAATSALAAVKTESEQIISELETSHAGLASLAAELPDLEGAAERRERLWERELVAVRSERADVEWELFREREAHNATRVSLDSAVEKLDEATECISAMQTSYRQQTLGLKKVKHQLADKSRETAKVVEDNGRLTALVNTRKKSAQAARDLASSSYPQRARASADSSGEAGLSGWDTGPATSPEPQRFGASPASVETETSGRELRAARDGLAGCGAPGSAVGPRGGGARPAAPTPPARHTPCVAARFVGWKEADGASRLSALKAENGVLLALVGERDTAIDALAADMSRLQQQHAAMRVRWRAARGADARGSEQTNRRLSPSGDAAGPAMPPRRAAPKRGAGAATPEGGAEGAGRPTPGPGTARSADAIAARVANFTDKVAAAAGLGAGLSSPRAAVTPTYAATSPY